MKGQQVVRSCRSQEGKERVTGLMSIRRTITTIPNPDIKMKDSDMLVSRSSGT
jgi:hypothetical protein